LRNLDRRAQPSPNAIPVAGKIKKVLNTMRYRRQLLAGRMAASAYDRTIGQALSIGGGMCPLHRKRQTSVNTCKFGFHFEKIQAVVLACH